ncbi:MAG: hypothetical protein Q9209_003942 [Squamulea sp. 1 TL-2023]
MAILGDLVVGIAVNNQRRTDYRDEEAENQNSKFVSRYVECKSGASFSIHVEIKKTIVLNYGIKQTCVAPHVVDMHVVDGWDNPFATFQFKYRSKNALQSLQLIRRTPPPAPPSVPLQDRPIESLTVEEMRRLLHQQRESRNVQPQARSKLESNIAEQHIKHENETKPQPRIKNEQDVKVETGFKRERDEEVEEILASAYVKKAKRILAVDLTGF